MRIDIKVGQNGQNTVYLTPSMILQYLIGDHEGMQELVIFNPDKKRLITTDKDLYEALGSIKHYDNFKVSKLTKLFEVVDVFSFTEKTKQHKPVLTFEKVEHLRKQALSKKQANNNTTGGNHGRR